MRFRDIGIFAKIVSISVLTLVLVNIGALFYFLPIAEDALLQDRRLTATQLVESALSLIVDAHGHVQHGDITEDDAKKEVLHQITALRYGGDNYFWISDLAGTLLAHPGAATLVGTNTKGVKDAAGFPLFDELTRQGKENGEGFVSYVWPKLGSAIPQPKISYVKRFTPWGWLVGTGIYTDDVKARIAALRMRLISSLAVGAAFILLLVFYTARRIAKPLALAKDTALHLAQGNIAVTVPDDPGRDETGQLLQAMREMIGFQRGIALSAEKIAHGDLTVQVEPQSKADVMALSLARMVTQLHGQISDITNVVNVLAASTAQISVSMDELATSSSETAVRVSQTMTSMEQIKQNSQVTFDKAKTQADHARKTAGSAAKGTDATSATIAAMTGISEKSRLVGERISDLKNQAVAINSIVATVEDLADQSKVLAVNASIEAAKAGREGEGFAVVAAEMRKLSEQSKAATGEIRTILLDVLRAVESVTTAGMEGANAVDKGVEQSRVAASVIQTLAGGIDASTRDAMEIASASRQTFSAVEQAVAAMDGIREASALIQSVTQQLSESAANLKELGASLQTNMARYTT
ncbi:MAG: cache domain-containing protein [Desulfovibrionaceae bacterium]